MADATSEKAIALPGLALLDALCPPAEWVTDFALGATYSLELPVALAALVALAGTAREKSDYGLHSAVRALHALSGKVRLLAQQGRVQAPPRRSRLVHLLDQVVRPVAWDERERSFHPKTWLVRWTHERHEAPARWVLVVGSRNLTSAQDWDLGVTLEGEEGGDGEALAEVSRYAAWLCAEGGLGTFGAEALAALAAVRWKGPLPGVAFGFHDGKGEMAWKDAGLTRLGRDGARRVLLVSPFLDAEAVAEAARALPVARAMEGPPRRLVAGRPDLEELARRASGPALLRQVGDVRCLAPSPHGCRDDVGEGPVDAGDDEAPHPMDYGLHAKAAVVWHGKNDLSILLGSANLTRRGWRGVNAEAWVWLRGRTEVGESLWAWSGQYASSFEAAAVAPLTDEEATLRALEDDVDALRAQVATTSLTLDESGAAACLRAASPLTLAADQTLTAARLAVTGEPVPWPTGAVEVALAPCRASERSALIVLRATASRDGARVERAWVQSVAVVPAIDGERDAEAIAEALGPRQFMAFLSGLLDPGRDDGEGDPGEAREGAGATKAERDGDRGGLSLEAMLRAFARRDGAGIRALHEQLGRAIGMYRRARSAGDDAALRELWEAWDAMEKALGGS